ncbi:hypothetical protein Acsp06_62410 [Actinomycetospora sp. NBRC 106375]|uniref:hypothetical protein n=1 Tax=Actinomycetospora sp. NBRC 106375 TaxID=3032207 RepID=UPI0024A322C9|nr:hypothetical protein [Actinomycetospora sp. NBRC 106375]GLZ50056.1 hypothetical protein Acsp06_62410 [Actinomycetospora sp. NBRC 106375]
MAVETVLLALLGLVAVWLVIDAGRERHRLRARVARDERWQAEHRRTARAEAREAREARENRAAASPDSWRYWPLTLPQVEDGSSGPRL